MRFAYAFENMLNGYKDPVLKQMAVEFFSVLAKILQRHPEITFIECIDVDEMLNQAVKLYSEDKKVDLESGKDQFLRDSVAQTSIYMGKTIIINLLDAKSLSQFALSASASEFQCKVQ